MRRGFGGRGETASADARGASRDSVLPIPVGSKLALEVTAGDSMLLVIVLLTDATLRLDFRPF